MCAELLPERIILDDWGVCGHLVWSTATINSRAACRDTHRYLWMGGLRAMFVGPNPSVP
jgi:hypothetical protein